MRDGQRDVALSLAHGDAPCAGPKPALPSLCRGHRGLTARGVPGVTATAYSPHALGSPGAILLNPADRMFAILSAEALVSSSLASRAADASMRYFCNLTMS